MSKIDLKLNLTTMVDISSLAAKDEWMEIALEAIEEIIKYVKED